MKKFTLLAISVFLFLFVFTSRAQIAISAGATVIENFDSMGPDEVAVLPPHWRVDDVDTVRTVGLFSDAQTQTENRGGNGMSITSSSGIYNFGAGEAATAGDRAVGWLSANNATESGNLYTCLKNTGTENIYNFSISYNIEKYRRGANNAGFTIHLYYSFDGETWVSAGTEFITDFPDDGFSNNGYSNAPGLTVEVQNALLDVPLYVGDSIFLAWNYSVTSGTNTAFAQALAIDDVSVEAHYFPPAYDMAVTEWIAPTSQCALSSTETVSIMIKNMGIDTVYTFELSYATDGGINFITPEIFNDTLIPGEEIIYHFSTPADFSATGTYNCVFAVSLLNDQNTANDTMEALVVNIPVVDTYPHFEDFESFSGWTTDSDLWQYGTPAQQFISSSNSGIYAWMTGLAHNYDNNAQAYLYSPCYDFTHLAAPQFSVWLNMNIPDLGNDAMILEYSTDGGNVWHKVAGAAGFYNYTGTQGNLNAPKWSGNTNGWEFFETPLTGLAGEPNVRFRFLFESDASANGEGIAIDDITIRDPFSTDLALLQWIGPESGCGLSDTSQISVQIANVGSDTIIQFPVTYSVDGGVSFIPEEIVNDTLAPGDTIIYTFLTVADLSVPQEYSCVVQLNLVGDENPANNEMSYNLFSIPYVTTYPYNEDFDMAFTGWQSGAFSGLNQWEVGAPNQTAINSAYAGANAWMTRLSFNYNNSAVSYLASPCYDFTNLSDPYFSAMINMRTEPGYDAMVLEKSIDGGNSWSKVTGDAGFYNNNSSLGPVAPPKWSGNNNGWVNYETSLASLAGETEVRFRFVFTSNSSNNDEGIAIDDVIVRDRYDNDLAVVGWVAPTGGCGLSDTETVTISVANLGKNSQTGFSVGYSINGGTYTFENFTNTINPGDTLDFTFSTTYNFSMPMDYNCMGVVNLTADENPANDAYVTTIVAIPYITNYPYFQDFEMGRGGWSSGAISGNDQWEFGLPQQTVINSAQSGIHTWMTGLASDYENNVNTYLESPCLDFTSLTDPQISVWLNMNISDEGNDAMILEYSLDDGQSWLKVQGDPGFYNFTDTVGTMNSPKWSGHTVGWQEFRSALTGLAGENNVKLRFRFESDALDVDEGIAIDDIMIHDPFSHDMAVIEWVSPLSECNMTAAEDVTILIANLGTVPQSNFDLAFSTDGGMTFSPPSTFTGTINPGDTIPYTFPITADFSMPGQYNCIATVHLATEENPSNDMTFARVYAVPTFNIFPYFDDFEAPYSGWTSIALEGVNQWEKGTPGQQELSYAHSGSDAFMTRLHANYSNNANAALLSPCLNMSAVNNPQISVWLNMKTEQGYDAMLLEKSTDGGGTWHKLSGDPGFYNNSSTSGPINNPPKWSGTTDGWTNFTTAASGLMNQNNVRLRFRFASDETGTDEGIAVDDFLIYQPVAEDLGVTAIIAPVSDDCGSVNDSVFIEITNFGFDTQTQIPVKVDIVTPDAQMTSVWDTLTTSLAQGQSEVFFINTFNTTQPGTYFIFASTELPGDTINHFNNLTTSSFYIKTPLSLPYVEDFEADNDQWTGNNINIDQAHGSATRVLYAELSATQVQAEASSTKIGPLTELSIMKFDYRIVDINGNAYTMQSGDAMQVNITNDCFENKYMLLEINENNHVPATEKNTIELDVSSFDTDIVFLNFEFFGGGSDFYIDIDNIIIADAPVVDLGNDTSICTGSLTLFADIAPQNMAFYWRELSLPDTISTAPSLNVTQSGYYHVSVDNGFGMTASDSIEVFINPLPVVDLGPNIYICSGETVDITASGGVSYLWNTGDTTAVLTVSPAAVTNYSVTVTDNNGCFATDDINVITYQLPVVNLVPDQTLCEDDVATLNAGSNYMSYIWSTGDTTQYLSVDSSGIGFGTKVFSVTVTDVNGCHGSDSVSITFENCTGIQEPRSLSYDIYPNPTDGNVYIRIKDAEKDNFIITLYNIKGRMVYSYAVENTNKDFYKALSLHTLSKGLYFIKIVSENDIHIEKLILH